MSSATTTTENITTKQLQDQISKVQRFWSRKLTSKDTNEQLYPFYYDPLPTDQEGVEKQRAALSLLLFDFAKTSSSDIKDVLNSLSDSKEKTFFTNKFEYLGLLEEKYKLPAGEDPSLIDQKISENRNNLNIPYNGLTESEYGLFLYAQNFESRLSTLQDQINAEIDEIKRKDLFDQYVKELRFFGIFDQKNKTEYPKRNPQIQTYFNTIFQEGVAFLTEKLETNATEISLFSDKVINGPADNQFSKVNKNEYVNLANLQVQKLFKDFSEKVIASASANINTTILSRNGSTEDLNQSFESSSSTDDISSINDIKSENQQALFFSKNIFLLFNEYLGNAYQEQISSYPLSNLYNTAIAVEQDSVDLDYSIDRLTRGLEDIKKVFEKNDLVSLFEAKERLQDLQYHIDDVLDNLLKQSSKNIKNLEVSDLDTRFQNYADNLKNYFQEQTKALTETLNDKHAQLFAEQEFNKELMGAASIEDYLSKTAPISVDQKYKPILDDIAKNKNTIDTTLQAFKNAINDESINSFNNLYDNLESGLYQGRLIYNTERLKTLEVLTTLNLDYQASYQNDKDTIKYIPILQDTEGSLYNVLDAGGQFQNPEFLGNFQIPAGGLHLSEDEFQGLQNDKNDAARLLMGYIAREKGITLSLEHFIKLKEKEKQEIDQIIEDEDPVLLKKQKLEQKLETTKFEPNRTQIKRLINQIDNDLLKELSEFPKPYQSQFSNQSYLSIASDKNRFEGKDLVTLMTLLNTWNEKLTAFQGANKVNEKTQKEYDAQINFINKESQAIVDELKKQVDNLFEVSINNAENSINAENRSEYPIIVDQINSPAFNLIELAPQKESLIDAKVGILEPYAALQADLDDPSKSTDEKIEAVQQAMIDFENFKKGKNREGYISQYKTLSDKYNTFLQEKVKELKDTKQAEIKTLLQNAYQEYAYILTKYKAAEDKAGFDLSQQLNTFFTAQSAKWLNKDLNSENQRLHRHLLAAVYQTKSLLNGVPLGNIGLQDALKAEDLKEGSYLNNKFPLLVGTSVVQIKATSPTNDPNDRLYSLLDFKGTLGQNDVYNLPELQEGIYKELVNAKTNEIIERLNQLATKIKESKTTAEKEILIKEAAKWQEELIPYNEFIAKKQLGDYANTTPIKDFLTEEFDKLKSAYQKTIASELEREELLKTIKTGSLFDFIKILWPEYTMENPTEEVVNNAKANAQMISGDMELKTALMDRFHQMHNKFKAAHADSPIYYNTYNKEISTTDIGYQNQTKKIPIYYFSNTQGLGGKPSAPANVVFTVLPAAMKSEKKLSIDMNSGGFQVNKNKIDGIEKQLRTADNQIREELAVDIWQYIKKNQSKTTDVKDDASVVMTKEIFSNLFEHIYSEFNNKTNNNNAKDRLSQISNVIKNQSTSIKAFTHSIKDTDYIICNNDTFKNNNAAFSIKNTSGGSSIYYWKPEVIERFTKSIKSVYDNQSVSSSALSGMQAESKKKMPDEVASFIDALERLKDNNQQLFDNNKELDPNAKGAMEALSSSTNPQKPIQRRPAPGPGSRN